MPIFSTSDNLPAGTPLKAGESRDIDKAIAEGNPALAGVTINAAGNYVGPDGRELTSAGGTTTVVDVTNATDEEKQAIAKLAEVHFLAQTTGINSSVLDKAMQDVGIDLSDPRRESYKQQILDQSGYNYGDPSKTFDTNPYTGDDPAINILREGLKLQPTDEDLSASGLDPDVYMPVNDNVANSIFLKEQLEKMGTGVLGYTGNAILRRENRADIAAYEKDINEQIKENPESFYFKRFGDLTYGQGTLNILEWGDIKPKQQERVIPTTTQSGQPVTVQEVAQTPTPTATPGVVTKADPATLDIGSEAITPYFNPPNTTPTSTTATPAEDFSLGITRQGTAFDARTAQQAQFFQPQTLAEMRQAGQDTSAFTLTQRLYRNPLTGQQIYIPFYGDQPASPIPAGFVKVDVTGQSPFGLPANVFNPVTADKQYTPPAAVNQGGVIQGYQPGGIVSPPINFKPGGTVKEDGGAYYIEYPDGSKSQNYDTALNANQARKTATTNLGLPDYTQYLSQQGIDRDSPGYDFDTVYETYQSYLQGFASDATGDAAGDAAEDTTGDTTADAATQTLNPSNVYGDVFFQDPVSGQLVKQSPSEYIQTKQNIEAQTRVNPASAVAPMGVQYLTEMAAPGTVIEATAGRAIPVAPVIAGDQIAQVSDVTQSTGAVNPGAAQMPFTQAAPTVKAQTFTPATQRVPARDAEGNVLTDAQGNPIMVSAPTREIVAQQTRGPSIGQPLTDIQGNVLRDAEGNVIFNVEAATGTATDVTPPTVRAIETMQGTSELVTADAIDTSRVDTAFGTGQVQAASITGELATLMKDFEGGDTPAWAAGAMRQATAIMNERGLGASTMAGQAIVQAAMEAALPIAQIEAGNKQQIAMFNAQQRANFLKLDFDQKFQAKVQNAARVSEIANMNFSADQTIALENSRAANTVNLNNLSNRQGVIMAEAAALSQLDMANLNNRQQANVQNAQNFLQLDMANLSNSQQTALFQQQSLVNSILSDAAAANAAAQFNASSENQTNQFFSNLAAQVSQFNSAQKNAIDQFNAEEANAVLEFNSALQNQREMFNAQNYLVVAQANAAWRQAINTANTEAQNLSNAQYAKDINGLTQKNLDNYWQQERDIMSFFMASDESDKDRALRLLLAEQSADAARESLEMVEQTAKTAFIADFFTPNKFNIGDAIFKSLAG
jgi:hypothetical protein